MTETINLILNRKGRNALDHLGLVNTEQKTLDNGQVYLKVT